MLNFAYENSSYPVCRPHPHFPKIFLEKQVWPVHVQIWYYFSKNLMNEVSQKRSQQAFLNYSMPLFVSEN